MTFYLFILYFLLAGWVGGKIVRLSWGVEAKQVTVRAFKTHHASLIPQNVLGTPTF